MSKISKILVPTDGSPMSLRAEKMAVTLAKALNSRIVFVHIIPTSVLLMPGSEQSVALKIKNWRGRLMRMRTHPRSTFETHLNLRRRPE